MAGKTEKKAKQYIVTPRSPESLKEGFCIANGRRVPFDQPVYLSEAQVATLKRQKEPIQMEKQINVYELMEKHQITQEKANQMARQIQADPSMGGKKISFVPKFSVYPA